MKRRILILIFAVIPIFLLPLSSAMSITRIEGSANEKNEIILQLKLYSKDKKFGVYDDENEEQYLLFIREKTDYQTYSLINIECDPKTNFSIKDGYIWYPVGNKTVAYWGHIVIIEKEIDEKEIYLSIKISGYVSKYYMPFKSNDLDYPYDKYDLDLSMVFFTDDNDDNNYPSHYNIDQTITNYELKNGILYKNEESSPYLVHNKEYFGIIYETTNMQITRTQFETISINIFLWIIFYLFIVMSYMVWNNHDSSKVIRLYMGFFVPSLFAFGLIQNVISLATTPLIIFGSTLLLSTLLLCVNIMMPIDSNLRKDYREFAISALLYFGVIGIFFLLLSSLCNIFGYMIEFFIAENFSILSTILFIGFVILFIFRPKQRKKMKKIWKGLFKDTKSNKKKSKGKK